jgi:hypothetical protein
MPALTPDIWPSLDLVLPRKQRNQWSQRQQAKKRPAAARGKPGKTLTRNDPAGLYVTTLSEKMAGIWGRGLK